MKTFALILLVVASLWASPLVFHDDTRLLSHQGHIEYIKDVEDNLSVDDVRKSGRWTKHSNAAVNFGFDDTPYWYRLTLENASRYDRWIVQYMQTTIDWLDIYVYRNGVMIQDAHMGDHRYMRDRIVYHPTYLLPLNLKYSDEVTLYFRVKSPIHQLGLYIWEADHFQKRDYEYRFFLSIFFGVLLVIAIYNVVIFFLERNLAFLYFVGYLIALASFQFAKSGLYHFFEITSMRFNTHIQFFSAVSLIVMFTLFLREFLLTRYVSPKIDWVMRLMIVMFISLYLMQFAVSLQFSLQTTFPSALSIIVLLIYFGIRSWKLGVSYRIMIFAWLSFAIAALALALSKLGVVERNFFTEHAFYFGIIIESILMSLALSNKLKEDREHYIDLQETENRRLDQLVDKRTAELKTMNEELDAKVKQRTEELEQLNDSLQDRVSQAVIDMQQTERMLIQQSKMASMGEMIEAIAHQWRQPLNIASVAISKLELNRQLGVTNTQEELKALEQIASQIELMSHTIDDFRNFFKKDKQVEPIAVDQLIGDVTELVTSSLRNNHIDFDVQCEKGLIIEIYPNELKQVVLNIVNNAKDAIKSKKPPRKYVLLQAIRQDDMCRIRICDSGGGIDDGIIERIFEPYFTTKFESQGTGIGLYLAQTIIEKNLGGSIRAYNENDGACFEIDLALSDVKKIH